MCDIECLRFQPRFVGVAGGVAIALWFLWFAHGGLGAALSGDDLMNLHGYAMRSESSLALDMVRFWSTAYRPLGALFYLPLYHFFRLDPLPYRIGCFVLLGANLFLLFRFCARVTASAETALLATFLASYHAWFIDLYYSAGTVYDLACYPLYLCAFLLYIRVRGQGRVFGPAALAGISALYILALEAKEMAATLPLMLFVWEIVYRPEDLRNPPKEQPAQVVAAESRLNGRVPPIFGAASGGPCAPKELAQVVAAESRLDGRVPPIFGAASGGPCAFRWITRDARALCTTTIITVVYTLGKLTGKGSLVENPAYTPHISPGRYLDTFHLYMNPLFYQDHRFHDSNTVQILLAMLAFALWRRSPVLLFSWSWLLLTILPVAFIPHYAAFFEYLPGVGWVLYIATVLVMARRALIRLVHDGPAPDAISQVALLLATAAFLAPLHTRETSRTLAHFMSVQPPSRELAEDLARLRPHVRRGARILAVDDPFPRDTYELLFETRLFYRDMTIEVDQVRAPRTANGTGYDAILRFRGNRLAAPPD